MNKKVWSAVENLSVLGCIVTVVMMFYFGLILSDSQFIRVMAICIFIVATLVLIIEKAAREQRK